MEEEDEEEEEGGEDGNGDRRTSSHEHSQETSQESYDTSSDSRQQRGDVGVAPDTDQEQYLPEDETSIEIRPMPIQVMQRPTSFPR